MTKAIMSSVRDPHREAYLSELTPLVSYPITDPSIIQLQQLVRDFGILRPIVCAINQEGRYIIVDGNKLFSALVMLNYENAPIWLVPQEQPLERPQLWNLYTILNNRLPFTYRNAIDPLLDTMRLELTSAIIHALPTDYSGMGDKK